MAESDEEIKEAIETLEKISSDEEKERIAELRQKYIKDLKLYYNLNNNLRIGEILFF